MTMKKTIFFTLLGLILLVAALIFTIGAKFQRAGTPIPQPPTAVASDLVTSDQWETRLRSVGELEASQGVLLTADIAGRIASINFEAGSSVEKGELLVVQEVSSELTQLEAAEADKSLAEANLKRVNRLFRQKLVSRSEYDTAQAAFKSASAQVESVEATLDKKNIIAPFAGRLGLRQVNLGQNITAGTPIVSLQAADPMLLNFSLPQQQVALLSAGLDVEIFVDALAEDIFKGKVTAINSEIDAATRSVNLQARFSNPDGKLLPGMFASVEVILPIQEDVLMIPVTAISYSSFGDSVFVVEEQESETDGEPSQLVARQQFVQLGRSQGDFVSVTKGLEEGQRVVTAGVFKLRNNAPVTLNEEVKPEFQLNPELVDQ
ncbi:MAG: efflux RND transporter periplasmic adaptor subunit [Gammaproteobacteria bacterium]|nr:efflux RND transporter periplasmic adaptor subunit [Gammaproteobacteria bacterium]